MATHSSRIAGLLNLVLPLFWMVMPAVAFSSAAVTQLPFHALHMWVPKPKDIPLIVRFIKEALPAEAVNTLVLEFAYKYQFRSYPEVADPDALSYGDVKNLLAACRSAHIKLIPMIGLLGHQSHSKDRMTLGLLRAHPEFDETPGKYPNNVGIYARSYCPLHPKVHDVVFSLIDELMEVTEAGSFHAGMDEVMLLGEVGCPRCKRRSKAQLFAGEVWSLRDHLAEKHRQLWIWGDRLLDGRTTGVGEWEGSFNGTAAAIDLVPKDIVICDWHYENAEPTPAYFAAHGFRVLLCPWNKPAVGRQEVELMQTMRAHANSNLKNRLLGVMQTSWQDPAEMIEMYLGDRSVQAGRSGDSIQTFRAVTKQWKKN